MLIPTYKEIVIFIWEQLVYYFTGWNVTPNCQDEVASDETVRME